jgi:signal transduction histidine kinase
LQLDSSEQVPDVIADAAQLQQVVTNLVVNAVQATPESGVVQIHLRTANESPRDSELGVSRAVRPYVCIVVSDRGTGMNEQTLERIFEPFFTTKDIGEGTGLGLAVAYGIVQEHGGFITVESKLAEGSRFEVYLPVPSPP